MDDRAANHDIEWTAVVGGAVVGFVACWGFFAFAVLATYSVTGDSAAGWVTVLMWTSLAAVPAAFLAVALARRRRGQVVAGMLLGLTVGSIVGAGVCTTYSLLTMA